MASLTAFREEAKVGEDKGKISSKRILMFLFGLTAIGLAIFGGIKDPSMIPSLITTLMIGAGVSVAGVVAEKSINK